MFPNVIVPEAHGLYAPGLALLGPARLASASLALPAPATTAAARLGIAPQARKEAEGRRKETEGRRS